MKQLTYVVRTNNEFMDMLQDASRKMAKIPAISSILVTVFGTKMNRVNMEDMVQKLHGFLPDAHIIGSFAALSVADDFIIEYGVSVTFNLFEEASAEVVAFPSRFLSSGEIGQSLLERLQGMEDVKAVGLLLVDSSLDILDILEKLSEAPQEIQFFGGMTDEDYLGHQGCVFTADDVITSGVAALVLRGKDLHVNSLESFGWEALGRDMVVTGMDGPCVVTEIDNAPAIKAYEKYLGIKNNEDFAWEALTFPVYFERGEKTLARHPRSCHGDGAVVFNANIRVGDHLHFAYGDPEGILEKARELRKKMRLFRPQGIFLTSCVARWFLLGGDIGAELDACRELAPFSGFYSFGELRREGKELFISNMTLELLGMREGEPTEKLADPLPPTPAKFSWQTHVMRHMVHFIKSTSQELETVNQGLAQLAQMDRLTALLNRGELEAVLERSLEVSKVSRQPLSVIMMDIDDFKGINDNYGHAVGDEALKLVADVLRKNTRRMDAPGRWGGDEFFVILAGIDVNAAAKIAERVRENVSGVDILPDGKHITTSIGVTEATPEDDAASLFSRADGALYDAKKRQGKNHVSVVEPKTEEKNE